MPERKSGGPNGQRGTERAGPSGSSGTPERRPALTERQRREAREARRKRSRRSPKRERRPRGNPLVAGIRATGRELARTFSFLGGLVVAGLDALAPLASSLGNGLRKVEGALGVVAGETFRALALGAGALGRLVQLADRVLTPVRAILLVALGSALMLGFSQFIEYRAVEIGQAGYAAVLDVVSAPRTDGRTPIDEHSVLLVGGAIVALIGTGAAARGRRWGGFAAAGAGLLSIVVALLIDLPAGTDGSEVAAAYSGAEPVLLAGFWLQIAAGLGLVCCGALLAASPVAARRRARQRRRRPAAVEGAR